MEEQHKVQEIKSLILSDMSFLKYKNNYNPDIGFLYGSQNYGIDTAHSDKDRRIIVIPSLNDLICNKQLNKTYTREMGLVSTYDVRNFIKNLIRGSFNDWELFVTEYYETMYENNFFLQEIYPYRNRIIRINPINTVKCIYGQYRTYFRFIFSQDLRSYDKKAFVNTIRICDLLDKYYEFVENPDYSINNFDLLTPKDSAQLKTWKVCCPLIRDEVYELMEEYNHKIVEKYNKILEEWEGKTIDQGMQQRLEHFRYQIIKCYI